jgi:hypothetical protein
LSVALVDRLCELLESSGAPLEVCAASLGVSGRAVRGWRQQGAEALERLEAGELIAEREHLLAYAAAKLEISFARATLKMLAELRAADSKSWTREAWRLERSRPEQFALQPALRVDAAVRHEVEARVALDAQPTSISGVLAFAVEAGLGDSILRAFDDETLERLGLARVSIEEPRPALPPAPPEGS